MVLYSWTIQTPLGDMMAVEKNQHLILLDFIEKPDSKQNVLSRISDVSILKERTEFLSSLDEKLQAYFSGALHTFDIPLKPSGTDFQKRAWESLCSIPFGQTRTYGEQAMMMRSPKASRAVGSANGKNPISILIPCHRVVGARGALGGYNSGLDRKKWLLALEQAH